MLLRVEQELLAAGARGADVDRGIDALLDELAVEVQLGVAGALELLEDHFVGARARVDERGAEDGERAAVLDVARRTEELLRLDERGCVDAARADLAGVRHGVVVAARKTRDRVEQDHDMLAELHHAARLLHDHLGDLDVADRLLVKGARDDLDMRRRVAAEVGDFLGTLVDEQDDHMDILVVRRDRVRDLLEDHGLAGARRRHDERALAEAERRHHVDDARLDLARAEHLEVDALVRVERREVLEGREVVQDRGIAAVHALDAEQREVDLLVLRGPHEALHDMAAAQAEMADLRGRHIDVVGARRVRVVGAAQEAIAVGRDLEGALGDHQAGLLGARLQDLEDELLLRLRDVVDAVLLRQLVELVERHLLELREVEVVLLGDFVLALELLLDLGEFGGELLVGRDLARAELRARDVGLARTAATTTATTAAATTATSAALTATLATTTTTTLLVTHVKTLLLVRARASKPRTPSCLRTLDKRCEGQTR